MKKIIVIGGGVATKSFLAGVLDFYKDLEITVIRKFNKSPVPCGIPYAIGTLGSAEENISPDKNFIDKGVRFLINEAVEINTKQKEVTLKDGMKLPYDKLVLATGTEPVVPPIPGIKLNNIQSIYKDVDYVSVLKEKVKKAKDIIIVGGGFIGVELADEISNLEDKNISIIEIASNCLSQAFDADYCEKIEGNLKTKGINIYTNISIKEFKGNKAIEEVVLSNESTLKADLVLLNVGARPMADLAVNADLKISERGSIVVDRFMETSNPDILAIGDCASKVDFFSGKEGGPLLASVAAREGRIAAANLFEKHIPAEPTGSLSIFTTIVGGNYYVQQVFKRRCKKMWIQI
jgi:NADPH-dependent 2,4-dienoyl-CoA reductase/sulfur reductase-like enzyme